MGLNENLSIDIARRYTTHIPAKQADHGYDIIMRILRNGVDIVTPSSDTATFRAGKPDGTIYYGNATVNEDKTVSIHVDDEGQMLAVPGCVVVDVTLNDGSGAVKSTQNFVIDVQAAPGGEAIPSTSVFIELQELVDDANGKILDAEAWAVGTRNGIPVEEGDPAFDNNAKFYAGEAADDAQAAQGYASNAHDDAQDAHADMLAAQDAAEAAGIAQGHAEDAQEAAEDAAEDAQESAQEAAQAATEALWAYLPQDSASGAIATFPDGADNVPVDGLVISAEPIQDLHGYSNPWPAGGGKNLIPTMLEQLKAANTGGTWADNVYSISDLTFTVNADGTITVNGTSSAAVYFNFRRYQEGLTIPAGDYVLHQTGNANINVSVGKNNAYWGAATTSDVSLTLDSDATFSAYSYVANGKALTNFVLKPMLESGTTATTYEPYSNLCPISGRTGGSVTRTGKNVFSASLVHGVWANSSGSFTNHEGNSSRYIASSVKIAVVSGQTYTVSWKNDPSNSAVLAFILYFNGDAYKGYVSTTNKAFTVPAGVNYVAFDIILTNAITSISQTSTSEPQLELGSFSTSYEPYSGIVLPITFPTAAGTVYGGSVDVTMGKLTVTMAIDDLGSMTWSTPISANPNCVTGRGLVSVMGDRVGAVCSAYPVAQGASSSSAINNEPDKTLIINKGSGTTGNYPYGAIIVKDSAFASYTQEQIQTALTGVKLCYNLLDPVEYDFDPTELRTLLGTNNVWSDIGDVSVQYRADVQLYIQKLVAQALNA